MMDDMPFTTQHLTPRALAFCPACTSPAEAKRFLHDDPPLYDALECTADGCRQVTKVPHLRVNSDKPGSVTSLARCKRGVGGA